MDEKGGFSPNEANEKFVVEKPGGPSLEVVGFETSPMSNQEVKTYLDSLNPFLAERFLIEKVGFIQTPAILCGESIWHADAHFQTIEIFSAFSEIGKQGELLKSLTPKEKLQWTLGHEVGDCIFRLIDAIERRKSFFQEIAYKNQHDELLIPQLVAKQHLLTYYTAAVYFLPPITKYAEMRRGEAWDKQPQKWAREDFAEAYAFFKIRPEEFRRKSAYRFKAISLIDKLIKSSSEEVAEDLDSIMEEIEAFQEESKRINKEGQVQSQG